MRKVDFICWMQATCGAPHSTLVYWTNDEMKAEKMNEEDKAKKDAFSDLAVSLAFIPNYLSC